MIEGADLELFERSVRLATERHSGDALSEALVALGWQDALAVDPRTAVSVLFPLQGSANATSSALAQVLAAGLGVDADLAGTIVMPEVGSTRPPGRLAGARLAVRGLGRSALRAADAILVVTVRADALVPGELLAVDASELSLRPIIGVDPASGLVEASGEPISYRTFPDSSGIPWVEAIALVQLALAHELVGAARAMLELAREHALHRIQFGQPISKFQAVRHRLAESLVAIEAADAALGAAWDVPSPLLAATAKALAGRGARTTARHCQQVLAGIGFTAEHPFHRYYRRVLVLDELFGSARSLAEDLGRDLLASRQLPVLLPL